MLMIGSFAFNIELEQALAAIESSGIPRSRIMAVPMETARDKAYPSGIRMGNAVELGLACATALAVIGASVGFILSWGPIIWGLIGAVAGYGIGFAIRCLMDPIGSRHHRRDLPEVTILVECPPAREPEIGGIMKRYGALSIGIFQQDAGGSSITKEEAHHHTPNSRVGPSR